MQVYLILTAISIWLLVVSFFLYNIYSLLNKLTKGVEVKDLKKILENILIQGELNQKEFEEIKKRLSFLEVDGKNHVQKIGLIRFNPFKELGGDQSFCLAILDGEDSGVIITGLHTRDRTRVYMKTVSKGKSDHELSNEEQKALSSAYSKNKK